MKSCKPQTQIERARDAARKKRMQKEMTTWQTPDGKMWEWNCEKAKFEEILGPNDIEAQVCEDIKLRQRKGINKYGTTVANNPLPQREWLIHLYHELLDAAIYAKRQLVGNQQQKEPNEKQDKGKNLLRRRNSSNGAGNMDYL